MKRFAHSAFMILIATIASHASGQELLTPQQAETLIGDRQVVCGKVEKAWFASTTKLQETFLTLGQAYQSHNLTVVIPKKVREKFKRSPEKQYQGKTVCLSGRVVWYRGEPRIVLSDPTQIDIKAEKSTTENAASDGN